LFIFLHLDPKSNTRVHDMLFRYGQDSNWSEILKLFEADYLSGAAPTLVILRL